MVYIYARVYIHIYDKLCYYKSITLGPSIERASSLIEDKMVKIYLWLGQGIHWSNLGLAKTMRRLYLDRGINLVSFKRTHTGGIFYPSLRSYMI